jgi:hypothetical protein
MELREIFALLDWMMVTLTRSEPEPRGPTLCWQVLAQRARISLVRPYQVLLGQISPPRRKGRKEIVKNLGALGVLVKEFWSLTTNTPQGDYHQTESILTWSALRRKVSFPMWYNQVTCAKHQQEWHPGLSSPTPTWRFAEKRV